jgi:hypothetical protein
LATGLGGWRLDEENGVSDLDGGSISDGDEEVLHLLQLSHGLILPGGVTNKERSYSTGVSSAGGCYGRGSGGSSTGRFGGGNDQKGRRFAHMQWKKLDGEHICGGDAEMEEVWATGRHKWSPEKE